MNQDYVAGQRLGDYEIAGVLGAGGMGKVYKVRNTISDRVEAMKILLPNLAGQKELADRFQREIKLLASLDHPNIAALRTALTLDNQLVMIMECVEGITLAARLQQGPFAPGDAVNYADQILAALSYAHKLNVIHRDIKPGNMMLTPQGVVKLMDFGIARPGNEAASTTLTGTTLGSLNYMAPEQVKNEGVDARSDLYSLGVSLYEMVTGQLPFRGDSGYSLMTAHLQEQAKPPIVLRPDLPNTLNQIILIALSKEPNKRFQSADAFRNALKNVAVTPSKPPEAAIPAASAARTAVVVPQTSSTQLPSAPRQEPVRSNAPAAFEPSAKPAQTSAPQPSPSGPRGLYMALGGLMVVGVLSAAALYLPRRTKTHANPAHIESPPLPSEAVPGNPEPLNVSPTVSVPNAAAPSSPSTGGTDNVPARNSGNSVVAPASGAPSASKPVQSPAAPKRSVSLSPSSNGGSGNTSAAAAQNAGGQQQPPAMPQGNPSNNQQPANAAELEDIQQQADRLNSRAAAVSQSLDGLRRQQAAQGYGLRGDIVASEQRMQTNLSNAQSALQQQDATRAKKYLDMSEADAERLEKFLGR